jgi:hypothetical protein
VTRPLAALAALFIVLLPPVREGLEASMSLHMLVQAPLLALCGAVLAAALPARWRERIDRWNAHGIAGLFAVALAMALLMVPRLLDLAVADPRVDLIKAAILLACGAALRVSWARAGALVQGFFLGNVLPMTGAIGQLYQDSPLRLCNAYLLDDQVRLGQALVGAAVLAGVGWSARLLMKADQKRPSPDANVPIDSGLAARIVWRSRRRSLDNNTNMETRIP